MRISTSRRGDRHLTAVVAIAMVSALLISVSGITPAAAAAEEVNFELSASNTPEGSVPVINVQLSYTEPLAGEVTVTITAAPGATGDAAEPTDYTLAATPVVFPDTSISGAILPIPLTFLADDIFENSETVELTIANVTGGAVGANNTHLVTIANDDEAPTLRIFDSSTSEGSGSMLFTVSRSGETELTATAVATPSSGTATIVDEFSPATHAVSIPPGGTTASDTFSITMFGDDVYEPTETFDVTLDALGNASQTGSDLVAVGSIIDDDVPPTLSIDDVIVNETDGIATFTVTRTGQTAFDAIADIATADVEAEDDEDYTARSDTLTIPPGGAAATTTLTVPILDDDIDEDSETYSVVLSDPEQATILDAIGIGTIIDDDTAGITVDTGAGVFALEGDTPGTFTVVLTSEPEATVAITAASVGGEVTVAPDTLTFTPANWDESQSVFVAGVEDGIDEDDPHSDTVTLAVASADPRYDILDPPNVAVAVGDADALLVVMDGPTVGAPGDPVTFTATVNAGATGDITYAWTAFHLGNEVDTGDQAVFRFTPNEGGPYVIQVIVGDSEGQNPAQFIPFRALADIGSSIFADDIVWLAQNEITKGCNPPVNDLFCPTDVVTRGQMAAFLVRALGLTDDGGGNTFTDDDGSIFETDIAKLATAGITKGCNPPDNTNFCPNDPVTREQMAAFMVRALGLTDDGGGNTFTDDDGSIFETDIAKLATAGITKGCNPPDNTMFCPNDPVTREQMAAFIRRADKIVNP